MHTHCFYSQMTSRFFFCLYDTVVFNTPQYEQFIQTAIFVGNHMGLDKQLVVCLGNELAKLRELTRVFSHCDRSQTY